MSPALQLDCLPLEQPGKPLLPTVRMLKWLKFSSVLFEHLLSNNVLYNSVSVYWGPSMDWYLLGLTMLDSGAPGPPRAPPPDFTKPHETSRVQRITHPAIRYRRTGWNLMEDALEAKVS